MIQNSPRLAHGWEGEGDMVTVSPQSTQEAHDRNNSGNTRSRGNVLHLGALDHERSLQWLLTLITRMVRTRAKPDEAPPVSPIHTVVDRIWIPSPGYWKTVAILKEDIDKFLSKNCC